MKHIFIVLVLLFSLTSPALALHAGGYETNNKVGIGVLSPEADIDGAAEMVNSNGDWGWILLIIKRSEMNLDRWQGIFHKLTKYQLIPIVRIATEYDQKGHWVRPGENDAKVWADFLSKLYWPTKDRYIQVYNEVNRAGEWGGRVDPEGYAKELEKTIGEFKARSDDFFILNSPLDLAAPDSGDSMDAARYYYLMQNASPGIFTKIDGWASHSYPNPNFSATPYKSGRTGIDGYRWEIAQINQYLDGETLPVFITETGWDRSTVGEDTVANYFETAYKDIWNDSKVVAVTPFVFDYPNGLYHNFSFKDYPQFERIKNLAKQSGTPARINASGNQTLGLLGYVLKGSEESAKLSLKNTGNYIWKRNNLRVSMDSLSVEILRATLDKEEIYPGQTATFDVAFRVNAEGPVDVDIKVRDGETVLANAQKTTISETFVQRIFRIIDQLV